MPKLTREGVEKIFLYVDPSTSQELRRDIRIEIALRLCCKVIDVNIDDHVGAWKALCVVHRVSDEATPQFLVLSKSGRYFHVSSCSKLKELLPALRFQCNF